MDESKIIKKLDADLKAFAGAQGSMDEVFADTKRYRRLADQFWNTNVVRKPKVA